MNIPYMPYNYKKKKRSATVRIAVGAAVLAAALVLFLVAFFFFLDAEAEARRCQQKETWFDPWEDSRSGVQSSYKTWDALGMTDAFASDFKETYFYCFAFDSQWYPYIVKMKGEPSDRYEELMDYVYEEDAAEPEAVMLRGVAAPIPDDIRGFAIEGMNTLYNEEFLTKDNFEDYFGVSMMDMTKKPVGYANYEIPQVLLTFGLAAAIAAIVLLVTGVKKMKEAVAAEKECTERMRQTVLGQMLEHVQRMDMLEKMASRSEEGQAEMPPRSEEGQTEALPRSEERQTETAFRNEKGQAEKKSNVFLGIIGAIAGSLIGTALWILLSKIGFIAGIAGFVMLKFALIGYEKLAGKLDKKGGVISLAVTAFMVLAANVLDYVITICGAFFQWEASMDTVRYVIMNFVPLMTESDSWDVFLMNLIIGYGLSIFSSFQLIGAILRYRDSDLGGIGKTTRK